MQLTREAAAILFAALAVGTVSAAELVLAEMKTDLVPNPVPYAVLLPDGYKDSPAASPADRAPRRRRESGHAGQLQTHVRRALAIRPSVEDDCHRPQRTSRGVYMDRKDGTEKWESFIIGPYRELMEKTYHASKNPKEHFLTGISMGGMGTLRIGFKHPEMFGGIAALEDGIEPILHWKDMQPRHRFYREEGLFEAAFGKPVDAEYWEANNPASIAQEDPRRLIRSGLQIYVDAADRDMFFLYEGNEFLHRLLYDNGVEHEYHLVEGADHVGRTMRPRMMEAVLFLNRALNPAPPDPAVINARKMLMPQKAKAGIKDPLDPKP